MGNPLLAALYYGILLGMSLTVFYMRGTSVGGMALLTMTIKKMYSHFSIGTVTMIIDLIIWCGYRKDSNCNYIVWKSFKWQWNAD